MNVRIAVVGLTVLCAGAFTAGVPAYGQSQGDSVLLSALVKKGVLSDQEAEDIAAQEQQDYASSAASKINLSSAVKSITFYGDLRLRYELRDGTTPGNTATNASGVLTHKDSEDMNRWRYRLRFGAKGDMYDNFFWGIRAATNPNYDRSGNVTFGHSDAAGPFGKDQSLLALDQVYLGWKATPDFTFVGGQMPNPLYTTNLVWDDNLNPAGAAEEFDHVFNNGAEVFATAGQFVYQAASGNGITNGINEAGGSSFNNTFMFAEQAGFKYKFNEDTFFKAAATFYTYSGTQSTSATSVAGLYSSAPLNLTGANQSPSYFNGPFVGAGSAPTTNVSGINDLAVLETPMEFDFKVGKLPMRAFADFAYNVEADDRANAARGAIENAEAENYVGSGSTGNVGVTLVNTGTGTKMTAANVTSNDALFHTAGFEGVLNSGKALMDQAAYQVGVEAGQLKKKGDWDGKLFWQSTGYYAVDPNLVDADIFNAATNMQGVVVSVAHNWTDGLSSTLRYGYATQVNDKLATPNVNQDLQLGTIQHYNLFQADLMWKF